MEKGRVPYMAHRSEWKKRISGAIDGMWTDMDRGGNGKDKDMIRYSDQWMEN